LPIHTKTHQKVSYKVKVMALLSFSVFKEKILSGAKRQTIRAVRKNPIKVGDKLYMWWKSRSPEREKLGESTCKSIKDVSINVHWISVNGEVISNSQELDKFAIADGFENFGYMIDFFSQTHGLPFEGVLIQWDDLEVKPTPEMIEALNDWSFRTDYRGNDEDSDDGFIEPITPQWLLDDEGMIIGNAYL
jgi:hypothetical protein